MSQPPNAREPPTRDQIQALVTAGFSDLPFGEFLLLTLAGNAAESPRHWLGRLLESSLVVSADQVGRAARERRHEVATVAISHAGLIALGVRPSKDFPFPSIFKDGMGHAARSMRLGDTDAASWRWSDCASGGTAERSVVHVLVAHYWSDKANLAVADRLFGSQALKDAGLTVLCVPADPDYLKPDGSAVEPFRFRDGVAQPVIAGLGAGTEREIRDADLSTKAALEKTRIAAGEFVLGLTNEYGDLAYAPDVAGCSKPWRFGDGGSYIAVRQIVQDVAALEEFESKQPKCSPGTIEKMVGRLRGGTPLSSNQVGDAHAFDYRVADAHGFECPRGAHVRRANPRDSLGHDAESGEKSSRLHRLLRRGRAYRLDQERGMFFMALNADLDRQFAFVQQHWIANPRFGGLAGETDPILGQTHRAFTIPQPVFGKRITGLPRFTRVVGGGYFLLPSLRALKLIVRG